MGTIALSCPEQRLAPLGPGWESLWLPRQRPVATTTGGAPLTKDKSPGGFGGRPADSVLCWAWNPRPGSRDQRRWEGRAPTAGPSSTSGHGGGDSVSLPLPLFRAVWGSCGGAGALLLLPGSHVLLGLFVPPAHPGHCLHTRPRDRRGVHPSLWTPSRRPFPRGLSPAGSPWVSPALRRRSSGLCLPGSLSRPGPAPPSPLALGPHTCLPLRLQPSHALCRSLSGYPRAPHRLSLSGWE